jgi:hypothetical protein
MRQVSSKKVKPTPGTAAHLGDGSGGFLTFPVKKEFFLQRVNRRYFMARSLERDPPRRAARVTTAAADQGPRN